MLRSMLVNIQIEVPLLARRPTPTVIHNRAVEFGTVSDEKKAFGAVSLINKGSRKATFSVTWDKTLPLVFSPSEVREAASVCRFIWLHPVVMLQYNSSLSLALCLLQTRTRPGTGHAQ